MNKGILLPPLRLLKPPATAHPAYTFATLLAVDATATLVCSEIDRARVPDVERQALKDLYKGVKNLKCDILAYKLLLSAMLKDPGLNRMERERERNLYFSVVTGMHYGTKTPPGQQPMN